MKSSSALFKWPKNWRAPRPPPTLIVSQSQRIKILRKKFEIAILFRIVENHNNYVFGNDFTPTIPKGGAASYKLWPVFTYSNSYWEVYRRFQGDFLVWGWVWGEGAMREDLSLEEYVMGKKNSMKRAQDFLALL